MGREPGPKSSPLLLHPSNLSDKDIMPNHRIDPQTLRVFLKRTSLTALTALKRLSMSSNSGVPMISLISPCIHRREDSPCSMPARRCGRWGRWRRRGLRDWPREKCRVHAAFRAKDWLADVPTCKNSCIRARVCIHLKHQVYNYIILYLIIIYIYNVYICMTYDSATKLTFIRLQLTYKMEGQ